MRTTVVIQDDLLKLLRDRAHRQGVTLKDALNSALRRGVDGGTAAAKRKRYRSPSFAMGNPVETLNLDKALKLADTLADEEVRRKLLLRK